MLWWSAGACSASKPRRRVCDLGLHVTVLHLDPVLMNAQLDRFGGELPRRAIEENGHLQRTGTTADEVIGNGHVEAVQLRTGEVIPADLVVFACGIVPRVDVASASGVPVKRAILVNDLLATHVPGVYAVGECVEHAGIVYGLVQPIWEQCGVLADVLTGANPRSRYRGSKMHTRLKVAGVEVASFGIRDAQFPTDEVVQVFEDQLRHLSQAHRAGREAREAMLIGCAEAAATLVQMYDRDTLLRPTASMCWRPATPWASRLSKKSATAIT